MALIRWTFPHSLMRHLLVLLIAAVILWAIFEEDILIGLEHYWQAIEAAREHRP